jgi:hypothetical protein
MADSQSLQSFMDQLFVCKIINPEKKTMQISVFNIYQSDGEYKLSQGFKSKG